MEIDTAIQQINGFLELELPNSFVFLNEVGTQKSHEFQMISKFL